MKFRLTSFVLLAALCLGAFPAGAEPAKDFKFVALLVWATNAEKSPDPKHKPVDDDVRKALKEQLPLRWAHYFEVNRERFPVPKNGSTEITLSEKCKINVQDVQGRSFEFSLIGHGEPVLKRIQPLPKGQFLVFGGNAPDSNGWLVVLKRVE